MMRIIQQVNGLWQKIEFDVGHLVGVRLMASLFILGEYCLWYLVLWSMVEGTVSSEGTDVLNEDGMSMGK